jgi:hypothetical protein
MKGKHAGEQSETRLAALVFLSQAFDWHITIRDAEDWIRSADLPWFVKEVEKRSRELADFLEDCLENHAKELRGGAGKETARLLKYEFDDVRKTLGFITRIGKTVAETDSGKSTSASISEQIKAAFVDRLVATAFAAEAEELRRLRAGELKIEPPSDSKRPQP